MTDCPHCGRPMVPAAGPFDDHPVKRRIYDCLRRHPHGVSRDGIIEYVWANDPSGGPESYNTVAVHVCAMRKALKSAGLTIKSRGGPGALYRLVSL